jgi:aminoglycoside phosphotransferase (APT) family kinase protein
MIPAAILALVPGCEDGRPPLAVQPLPGGRGCNEVLRVDTSRGRFVWRHRLPPIERPGSRPADEPRAQQLAAAAGLAPAVLAAHSQGHWLLMEFIDAPLWTPERLQSEGGAGQLGRQLAQLHALDVPAELQPVDAVSMARDYLSRLATVAPVEARELAPLLDRIRALGARLAASGSRPVLNHGDLMVSNMLGEAPQLVDWEYAQVADATWDLACLLTYYPGMGRYMPQLLAAAGMTGSAALAGLELQMERFELLNRLWERLAANGAG